MYSAHRAMFRACPVSYVLCLILVPLYGAGLLVLAIWYLFAISQKLVIAEGRVTYERGILAKDRVELSVAMIRAVRISQTFGQRIFGVGDVYITSSGSDPEIVAMGMPDAKKIRALLNAPHVQENG